jgi:hypothetical protein
MNTSMQKDITSTRSFVLKLFITLLKINMDSKIKLLNITKYVKLKLKTLQAMIKKLSIY